MTNIEGCINDAGVQLVFGTVKTHKQIDTLLKTFAGQPLWGADIDGRTLFGMAQDKDELKAVTCSMNVQQTYKAESDSPEPESTTSKSKPKESAPKESKPKKTSSSDDDSDTSDENQSVELKGVAAYRFNDGVTVKLVEGSTHRASADDAEMEDDVKPGDPYMVYEFKVINNTGKPLDTMAIAELRYGSDGKSATEMETDASMNDDMDGRIQPGHSATGKNAYAVNPTATKVVIDFDPDMEHQVSFIGK